MVEMRFRFAISFFADNAGTLVVLFAVHRKTWARDTLKRFTLVGWTSLLSLMANAIAPRHRKSCRRLNPQMEKGSAGPFSH